ncbi:MAG: DUF4336 domain-containing protein [Myxococcales bacterium]|nr:DUF4336 domain-containing protein [Myxococcales bacterium]
MDARAAASTPLVTFGPEIWVHPAWIRFLGFRLQTRMTVVRLSQAADRGALWLHSPIGDVDALRPSLDALGEVRHLVAPNALHHLGLEGFSRAFSDATIWATKNVELRSGMRAHERLTPRQATPAAWGPDLELCVLGGNLLFDEALVLHRPSRTLIVTDFVEKIDESCTGSSWTPRLLTLFGMTKGQPAPAPEHRIFAVDPEPLRQAKERVLAWDFDRMIIAHGPTVEHHAKDELASCFDRAIRAATGRGRASVAVRKLWLQLVPR